MKKQVSQPDYGPNEWDFDFSFDLDLSFSDYLFLGFYLIIIAPIAFVLVVVHYAYCQLGNRIKTLGGEQEKQKASHGILSVIAKIF